MASYAIYVGKNLTADGSSFLAGYGDEPSGHWLEVIPRREHPEGTMIRVGVEARATYPGELFQIPQVRTTWKHITHNYSAFEGFPAPLTNGGLNEWGVAARDVWSPSRSELQRMTPKPQRGLNYSDLSRIAVERARTAREAVEIIGDLMNRYGYATYGGNSHLFADADEGWVVINFAGGRGLWIAERVGSDDIRVSRPGYIGEIPLDFQKRPDYMGSANFISFAVEQGWYDPKSGAPFNVNKIYGRGQGPARPEVVERLRAKAGKIMLQDMIEELRVMTADTSGYGEVAHLRKGLHQELGVLWVAATSATAAPFVPVHIGVTDVPPEFKWHRYLTEGEASRFMEKERQGLEATRSAFYESKRLFYLLRENGGMFQPEVTAALRAFEAGLIQQQPTTEAIAASLFEAGKPELARQYLTYYGQTELMNGLRLVQALAESIDARAKLLHGVWQPASPILTPEPHSP
ncbi:MAG: C69 family dipeptidase [Armatimonadetes bacterium]|nr:C69 family dipeptidase [Armatimonadota bacterium]